jgi:biofilm PGA synthesis protein PgaD
LARHRDWVLSALMWLLYLYLIREALIDVYDLADESVEWAFAGAEPPYLSAISHLLDTMQDYGIVVLANGAILIIWALYNQFRFRRPDRRGPGNPVSVADLAGLYGFPADEIADWQRSRILVMEHDPDGTLVGVISKDARQILSPPIRSLHVQPLPHDAIL